MKKIDYQEEAKHFRLEASKYLLLAKFGWFLFIGTWTAFFLSAWLIFRS